MSVLIGTSGWQYRHWRGTFYPDGLPQHRWLEHYAERFATVESNAAFYRLPRPETFADWAARTPADFAMAVKASRYLTHIRRLREPEEPVKRLLDHAGHLGAKLGPVLLQLPPDLRLDGDRLARTLAAFPDDVRVAVEFRHPSWFTGEVRRMLGEHGVALCLADRRGPVTPLWRTADWTYLRLHQGSALPSPCYGRQAVSTWADRLSARWSPEERVYVYLNNDTCACAVRDARRFALAAGRSGLRPTRVPAPGETRLQGAQPAR